MNLLLTGGCGFIGSNLVRLLLAERPDWRIVNLDKLTYAGNAENLTDLAGNPRYRFVRGDICNGELIADLFRNEKFDSVMHLAAESHVDRSILAPSIFIETNVRFEPVAPTHHILHCRTRTVGWIPYPYFCLYFRRSARKTWRASSESSTKA